jgi:hypothetical protein
VRSQDALSPAGADTGLACIFAYPPTLGVGDLYGLPEFRSGAIEEALYPMTLAAGIVVKRIEPGRDVKALAVARAEKSYGWLKQELGSGPKPFAGERLSAVVVNQTDEITATGHGRELLADGSQRKKESTIRHSGRATLMHDRGFGVGAELRGAPYRETLQATGRTTRIFTRRVFADSVQANSVASACIPPGSALAWRPPQPSMAFGSSYGKPELSTLPGIETFYFALTTPSAPL